ncbi:restriction endonuclease [Thauera sp. SDU_THAU2]|uniref:restriction endonuclease n=1 Tax=Thauera sp. SDU_THAU2 TaxID=3136633 RepID=UPI00311E68B1
MSKEKPFITARDLTLEEWLKHVIQPKHERKVQLTDYEFPTDDHRNQFLEEINSYPEAVVKCILQNFLFEGGSLGADQHTRNYLYTLPNEELEHLMETSEFIRRMMEPPFLPWQGNTWVLDLLPDHPSKAISALDAYFLAHCEHFPDGRARGLVDAEAVIKARYFHRENPRDELLALAPEDFEFLVAALYTRLGYKTRLTGKSYDGGVDVEAFGMDAGAKATILIQCKRYEDAVGVRPIRELLGVVSRRQANKGVVIATCRFTRAAHKEANENSMIELVDFPALNQLLNKCLGSDWPRKMHYEIRRMQLSNAKEKDSVQSQQQSRGPVMDG